MQIPLTCAHISDFHYDGPYSLSCVEQAVALLQRHPVDFVCLTGDYTSRKVPDEQAYSESLRAISQHALTMAIFGNHDGGAYMSSVRGGPSTTEALRKLLEGSGITVFENTRETLTVRKQELEITGLADLWSGKNFLPWKLLLPGKNPSLVMAHNPDSKDFYARYPWDLMLSGHTHGGQVVIPGMGAPFVPVQDTKRVYGLFDLPNSKQVHITSGVGNLRGIRINCRPEIAILKLVPGTQLEY
ncbi:MAG: hypothetical protein JWN25_1694 [Verrucomicrobiales bacterium]|nr:hypothetical protein [Verrucomicrobiales bacterium]